MLAKLQDRSVTISGASSCFDISTSIVAFLLSDNFSESEIIPVLGALSTAGAVPRIIAPRGRKVTGDAGSTLGVHDTFATMAIEDFDAIFIGGGERVMAALATDFRAVVFISDAYKQKKAIGATVSGLEFLKYSLQKGGVHVSLDEKTVFHRDNGQSLLKLRG